MKDYTLPRLMANVLRNLAKGALEELPNLTDGIRHDITYRAKIGVAEVNYNGIVYEERSSKSRRMKKLNDGLKTLASCNLAFKFL